MSLAIDAVTRTFDAKAGAAVDGVSLEIGKGELVALIGPSGSGKTTLLRMIGGLDFPDRGRILIDGEDATHTPSGQRKVGFVFQHYALFKHMSVAANVDFGMRVMRWRDRPSRAERKARVAGLLERVGLGDLADRYPAQLSGGQRQRVALARALAIRPRLLLLDEPFGALDASVRRDLRRWLRRLHDEMGLTTLFVTHDQEEALEIADRVVVMRKGRIEQVGTPREIEEAPATPFMHDFLGASNRIALPGAPGDARAFVRPHDLALLDARHPSAIGRARIARAVLRGGIVRVELEDCADGSALEAEVARRDVDLEGLAPGAIVGYAVRRAQAFGADGRPVDLVPEPEAARGGERRIVALRS